jgi:hypothetical protein
MTAVVDQFAELEAALRALPADPRQATDRDLATIASCAQWLAEQSERLRAVAKAPRSRRRRSAHVGHVLQVRT